MGVVHEMGLVVLNTPLAKVKSFTCLPSSNTTACKTPEPVTTLATAEMLLSSDGARTKLVSAARALRCHPAYIKAAAGIILALQA